MSDVYKISVDGSEVARVSGEGITSAKKQVDKWSEQMVDDTKLLRLQRDGKTILVFYVSAEQNVTCEKIADNVPVVGTLADKDWAKEKGIVREVSE